MSRYSLEQFAAMFADSARMKAYVAAIEKSVRTGDTVVDIGCGPGIFALLACKAGAKRVYAIENDGVVELGRNLAALNGFSDRIHFFQADSRQVHLPERADVVLSDIRGVLPFFSHAIGTQRDARHRFLAENGRLIPASDTLFCAVVEAPQIYDSIPGAWRSFPHLDLSSGSPLALNTLYRQTIKPEQLISTAVAWHKLEYCREPADDAQANCELRFIRSGTGHGLALWFETQLFDEIGFSTHPSQGSTVYSHIFLPWLQPLPFSEGEHCSVSLKAHLVGNDYIWQWETSIAPSNGRPVIHFQQSNFYGSLFPPSFLKKHAAEFVPVLSEAGLAESWLFQSMDGNRRLEDIASEAVQRFPQIFRRVEDAFARAAEIAEKFSR